MLPISRALQDQVPEVQVPEDQAPPVSPAPPASRALQEQVRALGAKEDQNPARPRPLPPLAGLHATFGRLSRHGCRNRTVPPAAAPWARPAE